MKIRVFTLRFDPQVGRFDDDLLQEFFEEHDALQVSEHFFMFDQLPTLSLVVKYRDAAPKKELRSKQRDGKKADAWRAALTEEEQKTFDGLRRWRNEKAKAEGKPPYVFLTNRQLHDLARKPPETLRELRAVEGVGDAKLESFGEELIAVIPLLLAGVQAGDAEKETVETGL